MTVAALLNAAKPAPEDFGPEEQLLRAGPLLNPMRRHEANPTHDLESLCNIVEHAEFLEMDLTRKMHYD